MTKAERQRKVIRYYLATWLPKFCRACLADRKHDDNELEWLQAVIEQAVDKYMTLMEKLR